MDISVVVPVYGCRAALHELHRRLVESVSTITDDFEIILVNDGSSDKTAEREYSHSFAQSILQSTFWREGDHSR